MRVDGYASIADYAAMLALPALDSPTVFCALLDADKGGRFALQPDAPYDVERRYLPGTNVLETTFTTEAGTVRVTDALATQDGSLLPWSELARRVEGLSGAVSLRWRVEPRFASGRQPAGFERRRGVPFASDGTTEIAVLSFDAGEPEFSSEALEGRFTSAAGDRALVALVSTHGEPTPLPPREQIESRLDGSAAAWARWLSGHRYDGPWRDAVERSALALELLVWARSGAIAAAPTTSLPEAIGGPRNWDYRFGWVRDVSFTLDALMRLGFREQAHASLVWLLDAVRATHPWLQVFYGLDGTVATGETNLDLAGYRGSAPVRHGNGAADQLQLGAYGDLFETVWLYVRDGNVLDARTQAMLADVADFLCEIWRNADAGLWELGSAEQYTSSKMSCWAAFDRALDLVGQGQLPRRHAERWRREAEAVRAFVERECWSEEQQSYTFYAGTEQLDASCLLAARMRYVDPEGERMTGTIEAVQRELAGGGPLLYRYTGMRETEGCFLACSFWLVEALARAGRLDEAEKTMAELLELANDVGLLSEEIDPTSKELLGNFPQALTHLALVNAAFLCVEAREQRGTTSQMRGVSA